MAQEKTYEDQIREKLKKLTGHAGELAQLFLEHETGGYYQRTANLAALTKAIFAKKPKTTGEAFANGMYKVAEATAGKAIADVAQAIADRMQDYIYGRSMNRRSFRTKNAEAYAERLVSLLQFVYVRPDFNLAKYLGRGKDKETEKLSLPYFEKADWIALQIDKNDAEMTAVIKDAMLGDNNTTKLEQVMIVGALRSNSREMHELVRDLLLAARLQEGLRQSILETADSGRFEAFLLLLQTILDNDLMRYSAAVRAVDVWMGLGEQADDSRRRVTEKLARLAYTYLTDENARKAAEESADVMELYTSLWAASAFDVTEIGGFLDKLMAGEKYQRLVAMYFMNQIDYPRYKAEAAVRYIGEPDLDVLCYVLSNIHYYVSTYGKKEDFYKRCQAAAHMENADFRNRLFARCLEILPGIPEKGHMVNGKPFDWCARSLTREDVFAKLFTIAGYENDGVRRGDLLAAMTYADADSRLIYLKVFVDMPQNEAERAYVFEALSDKSMPARLQALENVKSLELRADEDDDVIKLLGLKTGDIRQNATNILLALPDERVERAVTGLLADKLENKRLAGLDMVLRLVKEEKRTREQAKAYAALMPKATERERVLLDELSAPMQVYNSDNGFGLYDKDYAEKLSFPMPAAPAVADEKKASLLTLAASLFKGKEKHAKGIVFDVSAARMTALFDAFMALVEANKEFVFTAEGYDGSKDDIVLGAMRYMRFPKRVERGEEQKRTVDDFVLPAVWRGWLRDNQVTFTELFLFRFYLHIKMTSGQYVLNYAPWVNEIMRQYFYADIWQQLGEHFALKSLQLNLFGGVINLLTREFENNEMFDICAGMMAVLLRDVPEKAWNKPIRQKRKDAPTYEGFNLSDLESLFNNEAFLTMADECEESRPTYLWAAKEIAFIHDNMSTAAATDAQFGQYVGVCYEMGRLRDMTYIGLAPADVARAHSLGFVPRDALYKMFFKTQASNISSFTAAVITNKPLREAAEAYPALVETAKDAAARVIEIEVRRGDTPTEVSELARAIRRHEGAANFAAVLVALGNETFVRGYSWYGSDVTKKAVLSNLLKASCPAADDTVETLAAALDGRVPEKRLLEAAMYAPKWLPIVAEHLRWEGLESAAWYFHAHINETMSAEKETEVARYSPIEAQAFADGAFDGEWFRDAYTTLGQERFDTLYDCAKYLTEGANHRRAQLYADASLSKLKLDELGAEIKDKRNKDKLMAYSLIALGADKETDLLARYEFLQAFLKESKQFGAQRRESEAKACGIAIDNLARTAGYSDALRFSWRMETLKLEQIAAYFTPFDCDGVMVFVELDALGEASLVCEKAGKRMASVPAKLKKDAYILECKAVVTSLKAQQKRARASLENAMIRRDAFPYGELADLMKHPVISPMLQTLVFATDARAGGFADFADLDASDELRIAHPFDLYITKTWLLWQKKAFEDKIIQPFKQIFRELYLPNADELAENTVSRRYAGHQVQVQKTVALLKGRGWTVDYEDGLQKVYYKENIIAAMYAAADWFSPADVEAPTLETVRFSDRKSGKAIPLAAIPPVLFSEVMRDIDLVVAVAHVGGVDPEASHSTIEMRGAIVRELLALLKVANADVRERHVFVKGALGEYTVHLGSGGVQMMGKGAINILAIPSQHRGRVFLPFADEDPRTAEIMSKILLLAEDGKIKDPAILDQIGERA